MEKKELLKMNLQHFAEPTQESPKDEPKPPAQEAPKDHLSDNPGSGSDEPQPSLEEQMQQLRIENAKLKKAQEDAATDASNWKKKYNATLSDAEKLAQEKADKEAEKDAELAKLRKIGRRAVGSCADQSVTCLCGWNLFCHSILHFCTKSTKGNY